MANWNQWLIYCAIGFIVLTAILAIASLIRFKSILIKLIIIEILTNLLMASIAVWALIYHQPILTDICITLALIMFLGVVAYYQYLLEKEQSHVDILK